MARPDVVQVQFTPEEAERVRAAAESQGLSQSAFVRQLVISKIRSRAWWARPFYGEQMTVGAIRNNGVHRMHERAPDFYLELLYDTKDGGAAYRVFGDGGMPLKFRGLESLNILLKELDDGRVILAGSHVLWRIARSIEDVNMEGQLVWLMERDQRDDSEPCVKPK